MKKTKIIPKILIIRALEACNAGCFMCNFAFSQEKYRFTVKDAKEVAEQIKGTDIQLVRLTGGEPLMLKDIDKIINNFTHIGLLTSLITNGWYLKEKANLLAIANLSQVIISLDGACAETHDRFRRLDGLFDHIIRGISAIRQQDSRIVIRINTIIGPHNILELCDLSNLLYDLNVDQWSIIPLKQPNGVWPDKSISRWQNAYKEFQHHILIRKRPRLLGYSSQWMGRTNEEQQIFLEGSKSMTPRFLCRVVDQVRYYIPESGLVFPCNCIPHRFEGKKLGKYWKNLSIEENTLKTIIDFLRYKGPITCSGCEPINSALGEGIIDLEIDPFGF